MKQYSKQYEDVYSSPLKLKKCILSDITTDIGLNSHEYIDAMKKMMWKFEMDLFDNLVLYLWLMRRFHYKGAQKIKYFGNGYIIEGAFGTFMKHYVGTDKSAFNGKALYRILSYIKEFFPNLENENPFEKKMEYPFKYVGLSYLGVVYQMKDRMDFLNYAEENKMRYSEFLDYMINYVYCANEESNKNLYKWTFYSFNFPYIRVFAEDKNKHHDITMPKKYEQLSRIRTNRNREAKEARRRAGKAIREKRNAEKERISAISKWHIDQRKLEQERDEASRVLRMERRKKRKSNKEKIKTSNL